MVPESMVCSVRRLVILPLVLILRRVKADATIASIPVVAVSASVMKGERRRCLDAGFTAFVEKPFDVHQLRGLVARLVPHSPAGPDGPDPGAVADHEA